MKCIECHDGEHDNYDEFLLRTRLIDPKTGKLIRAGQMCEAHREMYLQDGYKLRVFVNGAWQEEGIGLYHGRRD